MADVKISNLPAVVTVVPGTDVLPLVSNSGASTTKATPQAVTNAALLAPGPIGTSTPAAANFTTIGATTQGTGRFTTLTATGAITANTTTNNQSYTTTGAGTITISSGAAGSIDNMVIGGTAPLAITGTNVIATAGLYAKTAFSGTYTDGVVVDYSSPNGRISVGTSDTLTFYTGGVASTVMATMTSTGINSTVIGATTAAAGTFTSLTATTAITLNTTTNNQSYTTTGAGTITITSGTTGTINNFNIGGTTAGTGKFTTLQATTSAGYTTGAGGTVTQLTSRTTGVTINKICGQITLFNTTVVLNVFNTFTVTNSTVAATDTIIVNQASGNDTYAISVTHVAAGSFNITVTDLTATPTAEAPVINFAVIKSVNA